MTTGNRYAFRLLPGMRRGLRSETPLPTRLVSNEEFPPLPQTPAQRRVEDRILAEADACHKANPNNHVRLVGYDKLKQTQGAAMVVFRGKTV